MRDGATELPEHLTDGQWECVAEFCEFYGLVKMEGVGLGGAMKALGIRRLHPHCVLALRIVDGERNRLEFEQMKADAAAARKAARAK